MRTLRLISSIILIVALSSGVASAATISRNAALRYWTAFAQMQDSAITVMQAKELNAILDGTAPYDDAKYKDLVARNRPALETMASAADFPACDWGLDYKLGEDVPVDYARKGLALGRLNVLYAFHLLIAGDKDGAVSTLAAGMRFSRDIANGGSLFATLVAKSLLIAHLGAVGFSLRMADLSAAQRLALQKAIARLGPDGLDWPSAAKRDLESLRGRFSGDLEASESLTRIISAYVAAINTPAHLSILKGMIHNAPPQLAAVIPNPTRVLEEKRDLTNKLRETRSELQ
ncbi:MAG: hypothetical protein WAM69_06520 [Candidatus Sulfotelmatobacter sp.]